MILVLFFKAVEHINNASPEQHSFIHFNHLFNIWLLLTNSVVLAKLEATCVTVVRDWRAISIKLDRKSFKHKRICLTFKIKYCN